MDRGHFRPQSDHIIYHSPHSYVDRDTAGSDRHLQAVESMHGHGMSGMAYVDGSGSACQAQATRGHPSSLSSSYAPSSFYPPSGSGGATTAPVSTPAFQLPSLVSAPATGLLYSGIGSSTSSRSQTYHASRRRSLGASLPLNAPVSQALYDQRAMPPPPSPPLQTHQAPSLQASRSPRHAPTSAPSPFDSARDLASNSTAPPARRHGAGMSISSMLGDADDRGPPTSPHSATATQPSTTPRALRPPSPARARASSMRESYSRSFRDTSPGRRLATANNESYIGHGELDPLRLKRSREESFGSPKQSYDGANGFRSFFPPSQPEARPYSAAAAATTANGGGLPGRPNSQPSAHQSALYNGSLQDDRHTGGTGGFTASDKGTFGPRMSQDISNGVHARDQLDRASFRDHIDYRAGDHEAGLPAVAPQSALPALDERANRLRSAYQPPPDIYQARESIESRSFNFDPRRESGRITPPAVTYAAEPYRNGSYDRPLTYEEHQRMEAISREYGGRKDSDGYIHRSVMNISPEMARRGRDSPLPQAVQGARSRHVGPGGDHPGIKSEFGRMFSGLGSGVGSATPVAGQSANGVSTPSRILSPSAGDLRATYDAENGRSTSAASRLGRKQGRKTKDRSPELYDGRMTPSLSARGGKRAKTTHPMHHHHHHHHHSHHHHHEVAEPNAGSYSMIRFPSNNGSQAVQSTHWHHHHHHGVHAHPTHQHHHHHTQHSSPIKKPTISIHSDSVIQLVADKPRKQLGSSPYLPTSGLSATDSSTSKATDLYAAPTIPRFDGKENCLFTVRVPKWVISQSDEQIQVGDRFPLQEIGKRRAVWGSDIYTDDSDVVAAAVHSGWIRGDFGQANDALQALDEEGPATAKNGDSNQLVFTAKPSQPVHIPNGYDMHITLLILPPLEAYTGTHQHYISSRDWRDGAPHDGMSFMIHRVDFVLEGNADRGVGRDAKSRKARIALEERKRREAAAALLMLPDPRTQGLVNGAVSAET